MGDAAEEMFVRVYEGPCDPYGLSRPNSSMSRMPAFIRYTPDFITSSGFVECKGVGQDQLLKVKMENIVVLEQWNVDWPVSFFINDTAMKRWNLFPLAGIMSAIDLFPLNYKMPVFHDNDKPYWPIPCATLPLSWNDAPA